MLFFVLQVIKEIDDGQYNKKNGLIVLRDQVILIDQQNNRIEAEYAEYYENKKLYL